MSALEEAIGLGVTIALIDQFSEGAEHVIGKFEEMERAAGHSAHAIREAVEDMKLGRDFLEAGTALAAPIIAAGTHAVETAVRVRELRDSVTALAGDNGELAGEVKKVAEASGLFDEEKMNNVAKNMLGMGVGAERIPGILQASAQAAAVLGRDVGSVANTFQRLNFMAESGMPITMRIFRQIGLTGADLMAQGLTVSKGKIMNSFDEIMVAAQGAIEKRFGARAEEMAHSVDALKVQIEEALKDGWIRAGEQIEPVQKSIMKGFLDVVEAGAGVVGEQFGAGVKSAYAELEPVGHVIKEAALALVDFLKHHPEIIKIGTAFALLTGIALAVGGALLVVGGAVKLLPIAFKFFASEAISSLTAVMAAVPGLLVMAGIAAILYTAWDKNLGGIRDTLTHWYESAKDVVTALYYLFVEGDSSAGAIPEALQQKLMDDGLWPLAQQLYVWGQRVIDFFRGVWKGMTEMLEPTAHVLVVLASTIGSVWTWISKLTDRVLSFLGFENELTGATKEASDAFKTVGEMVGIAATVFAGYKAAQMGYAGIQMAITAGTWAWNTAQWALNAALMANPIGFVIGLIALLVAGIVTVIAKWQEMTDLIDVYRTDPSFVKATKAITGVDMSNGMSDEQMEVEHARALGTYAGHKQALTNKYGENGTWAQVKDLFGVPGQAPQQEGMQQALPGARSPAAAGEGARGGGGRQSPLQIVAKLYLDRKQIHEAVIDENDAQTDRDMGD